MKPNTIRRITVMLALPSLLLLSTLNPQLSAAPLGTAFTYQGRLTDGANPATGIYDLRFAIYDASGGGSVLGVLTNAATPVTNGLFTVTLDFGADVFNGDARWLEIGVRAGTNDFTVLNPRQALTPTPYALQAANLTGTIADAQLSTNVALLDGGATFAGAVAAASFTGNGAGVTNLPATNLIGTMPPAVLPNSVLTNTTEVWLFTNATAYVNGHWTNWPSSTTAGIQECHNLLPWNSKAQPTITINFAGNTIFNVSTPIYLTNEMTFKGAGKVSSIIEWVGPTGWTSLQGVNDHPENNAMISMPRHGVGADDFPISMGNFVCLDMGLQTATDFPICLVADAAEHSDIERCAFLGPHAFSPNGNYRMLVLKEDMATSPSAVVGLAFSGADKAVVKNNVFAGLAVGFYPYYDGQLSGDHYEFSENDGGSVGQYTIGGNFIATNAYPAGDVLSVGCLIVDNGGEAGVIHHNHATYCRGCVYVGDNANFYNVDEVSDNLSESCGSQAIYVASDAWAVIEGQVSTLFGNSPVQSVDPTTFANTSDDCPGVISLIITHASGNFFYQLWVGINKVYQVDPNYGVIGNGVGLTNLQASAIVGNSILTNGAGVTFRIELDAATNLVVKPLP